MDQTSFDFEKLKEEHEEHCYICENQIPTYNLIFSSQRCIAFLETYPPTKGYCILAPKKHVEDITALSEEEYILLQKELFRLSNAISHAFHPQRICLLQSGGTMKHFHFHIIPMYVEVFNNLIDVILKKEVLHFTEDERQQLVVSIQRYLSH